MRKVGLTAVSLAAGLSLSGHAWSAAKIDLDEHVKALLASKGKVPYTHEVQKKVHLTRNCGLFQTCDPIQLVKQTDQVVLSAGKITIQPIGEIKFDAPQRSEINQPDKATTWSQSFKNCDVSSKGSLAIAISVQIAHQVQWTLTDQFALAVGGTVGIQGGVPLFATLSASLTVTGTDTKIVAVADQLTQTDTRGSTGTEEVAARTIETGIFTVWPIEFTIPFTVDAAVDADVSPNDKGWKRLSDIFPADKRTFTVHGVTKVTEASKGELNFTSKHLTDADCPADLLGTKLDVSKFNLDTKGVFDIK
jgi:hypothetical protein